MKKYCVLYNPYSGNNHGKEYAYKLKELYTNDVELNFISMPEIDDFKEFLKQHKEDIIICGGDGTINYFVNHVKGLKINGDVLYYSTGTGNDFHNEVGNQNNRPYIINKYIKDLPTVIVKDKEYLFLNGIGYGIDGYCCEIGDELKRKSDKPVNYTNIAIKGLLFDFKPCNAKITVDGKEYNYNHVWLAPTMNGKYYGGGMKVAPNQDRLNTNHKLTLVVYHHKSKIKTLIAFPSIFTGEHIKNVDMVEIIEGYNIKVEYDRPCALQIDGETILNVSSYEAHSYKEK